MTYEIECTSDDCAIMCKKSLDVEFWVNIVGNNYSVGYNSDNTTYSNEYISNVEDIFEEKINNIYKEYIEGTYTQENRNKFHFFFNIY